MAFSLPFKYSSKGSLAQFFDYFIAAHSLVFLKFIVAGVDGGGFAVVGRTGIGGV